MCFPVAIKHGEDTRSLSRAGGVEKLFGLGPSKVLSLVGGLNKLQEWSEPSKPYQIHPHRCFINNPLESWLLTPLGPFGESPDPLAERTKGKLLSLELGFLLVQGLSDLLDTK